MLQCSTNKKIFESLTFVKSQCLFKNSIVMIMWHNTMEACWKIRLFPHKQFLINTSERTLLWSCIWHYRKFLNWSWGIASYVDLCGAPGWNGSHRKQLYCPVPCAVCYMFCLLLLWSLICKLPARGTCTQKIIYYRFWSPTRRLKMRKLIILAFKFHLYIELMAYLPEILPISGKPKLHCKVKLYSATH